MPFLLINVHFAAECKIKEGKDGIHLTMSPLGRPSGEAYIELETAEDAAKALKKDHEHMGHRYIEGIHKVHHQITLLFMLSSYY